MMDKMVNQVSHVLENDLLMSHEFISRSLEVLKAMDPT